jgi:hypothetical protein
MHVHPYGVEHDGISANVVAGFTHDHLFVAHDRVDDAVRTLVALAATS